MNEPKRRRMMRALPVILLLIGGGLLIYGIGEREEEAGELVEVTSRVEAPMTIEPFVPVPFSYEEREPSRNGSGKIYMGREISLVMGHQAINWLERARRADEESPRQAVGGLELKPDSVVADIGSGSGYYSFLIAPLVPKGRVIGVDIQPEMVDFLNAKAQRLGVDNVGSHLGKVDSVELPAESVDAVLLVDAYHEFSHPNEMMQSIAYALRPRGRMYLLEYRAEDARVPIKRLHKMTEAQAIAEVEAVGLHHVRTESFLPWQHFLIFEKRE